MKELFSEKNFARLSKEVHELIDSQTWMQKYGYEWLIFFLRILGFTIGFLIFSQKGIFYKIFGMLILSYFYYGITITGVHESSHKSFVKSSKFNNFLGYVFSDFWGSQSSEWWYKRHIEVHHVYTNMPDKEQEATFYYSKIGRYAYFFLVPYLVVFWEIIFSVEFLKNKWKNLILYLSLMTLGWTLHIYLFSLILPIKLAFLSTFI